MAVDTSKLPKLAIKLTRLTKETEAYEISCAPERWDTSREASLTY